MFGKIRNRRGMARMLCVGCMMLMVSGSVVAEAVGEARQKYRVYVDGEGVMRRSDNKEEVSYYGTNYTAPFAYSYRALGYLGKDRKRAIDRDVHHIARLGLNAFRLHLWDAELADSVGNLLQNEHLDLLDYMLAQFERRGIDIILTAQTNFGNGYPERNIDTGAFTYDFDKCRIHEDPEAQKIQERYLTQLARHVNPYTGRSYAADNAIIAMEINNEPCHSGTKEEVTAYVNRMAAALRKAGFRKPILYNVTHNSDVTSAYYDAKIDGTTYQWYPTGLVAGHERKGNLLPAFDEYTIPWKDTIPAYGRMARVVYEFDPADVLYSHLYPAVARTFRKEGFQWITQFAYDPMDLAPYNTEYPTHYLNLVYTPAKALSMMVAREVAAEVPRGADYGSYPANTAFGHTRISYEDDLSEFNSPEKFIYTNSTTTAPADTMRLRQIAGHGSSAVVSYPGSGAYFLDAVGDDPTTAGWRLEVMPDIEQVSDPFGNTSLLDAKTIAIDREHKITVKLPALGPNYYYRRIDAGASGEAGMAHSGEFTVTPGVWMLAKTPDGLVVAPETVVAGNIALTEYSHPDDDRMPVTLLAPEQFDAALDVNAIPEAWEFKFNKRKTNWDEEPTYELTMSPAEDGLLVIRRYVADKINALPAELSPTEIGVRFQQQSGDVKATPLPAGTELAVVTRDGFTYSASVTLGENGIFTTSLKSLKPRRGVIMPAPYPVMMTREYPAGAGGVDSVRDIEFVELLIPRKQSADVTLLPERIWIR